MSEMTVMAEAAMGAGRETGETARTFWRRFCARRMAVYALWLVAILYVGAAFAEVIAPYDPGRYDLDHPYAPPQVMRFDFSHGLYVRPLTLQVDPITFRRIYIEDREKVTRVKFWAPSEEYRMWGVVPLTHKLFGATDGTCYLLGTDRYGRDIFSRVVYGARISLSIGLLGVVLACFLGVTIGGISGYVGGRTDNLIQRGIEVINAFPHVPLWVAVAAALPRDWSPLKVYFAVTIVLALLTWTSLARVVRGKILVLREEDYAVAARVMGASHGRVLFRHLVPGFMSHILVSLTFAVPAMILGETALSFLGLGLRDPLVSWGVMLQDCLDVQAIRYYPWLLSPVVFIVLAVLAFNYVGDALRDAADPYAK